MYRLLLLVVAIGLTACSQTSEFRRPDLPVPADWPVASSAPATPEVLKTHWRNFFADPQLQALIQAALEHNRDLRIAAARVEEARAQYGIVRADLTPNVGLTGSSSQARIPGDLSGTGAPATSTRYDLSLTAVSFELDFWGRLAGLSGAARLSYLATEEARRSIRLSLVAEVASAYFTLLQMNELRALARTTVELREQSLDLIAKGRDVGGTYDYEFQQASGILESTRANLEGIEHQRTVAMNRLNFLVGHAPVTLPQETAMGGPALELDIVPELPAAVLLRRPDVVAAEQRLLAAHASVDAARAAFFPKILLTAGLGVASQGLAGLFSGGAWSFQPVISLPLMDGGRLSAGVDVAEARKVMAVADYEKTIQLAFREVADLLSLRASLSSQLRASEANAGAQDKRLQMAQARYQAGLVSYLEVLDGQRELIAAQQFTTQVRRAQLDAVAMLYKALGGGSD